MDDNNNNNPNQLQDQAAAAGNNSNNQHQLQQQDQAAPGPNTNNSNPPRLSQPKRALQLELFNSIQRPLGPLPPLFPNWPNVTPLLPLNPGFAHLSDLIQDLRTNPEAVLNESTTHINLFVSLQEAEQVVYYNRRQILAFFGYSVPLNNEIMPPLSSRADELTVQDIMPPLLCGWEFQERSRL